MGVSRALGALLCAVCVVLVVAHVYFGYIVGDWAPVTLAFALPVTAGVLVLAGLGFWLGWIMASTKEVSPAPSVTEGKAEEEKKRRRRRR